MEATMRPSSARMLSMLCCTLLTVAGLLVVVRATSVVGPISMAVDSARLARISQ